MTPQEAQRRASLDVANVKRRQMGCIKADLRAGRLQLGDVMRDWPAELASVPLVDLIRWTRGKGPCHGRAVVEIGRRAVRDKVNLMVPLGDASARSREWVAVNATYYWQPSVSA